LSDPSSEVFAREVARLGPLRFTDTLLTSVVISIVIVVVGLALRRHPTTRELLEALYEKLERSVHDMVQVDARPLVPLVLTLWLFLGVANLAGMLPAVSSPTRDLSITSALALVSFFAGHVLAFREQGFAYLKQYLRPSPFLLPFNVIGELSRTLALALRLFGNMLSAELVGAILFYLVGFLLPVPLMLLGVLTAVVQAYIFGVLTLVFAASSMKVTREHLTK
jgi:F-type H+-transporting ATPase subunit a